MIKNTCSAVVDFEPPHPIPKLVLSYLFKFPNKEKIC